MAFMMPVVKNQYNIYPCRSRKSSTCSSADGGSRSRKVSESAKSTPDVLSTSPQSTASMSMTPRHIRYAVRSNSQDSNGSSSSSSSATSSAAIPSPKSGSSGSLQKFHTKLVEKLRRKFKGKAAADDDDGPLEEEDRDAKARSSS